MLLLFLLRDSHPHKGNGASDGFRRKRKPPDGSETRQANISRRAFVDFGPDRIRNGCHDRQAQVLHRHQQTSRAALVGPADITRDVDRYSREGKVGSERDEGHAGE